jgi:2-polyprenyl-3-methyl-5-hydroxy-6-metoxy-1,4-benzoquinol methylase
VTTDSSSDWAERTYWLSAEQTALLLDATHPAHVSPLADMVAGVGSVLGSVVDSYRTGTGVPYSDYGTAFRDGQAGVNRPAFVNDLVESWVGGSVPEIAQRLREGGNIADVGCGAGWSTIALAEGFPAARVVGIDSDSASILDARRNAGGAGIEVTFKDVDGASLAEEGPFDLIVMLEALHDLSQPEAVLAQARSALNAGGALLVADEKVAIAFQAPGDEMERMMYGWSVVHCLPASMAEHDSAAVGTVLRESLVRQMAAEAGFSDVETPDIDAGFFRLYLLRP